MLRLLSLLLAATLVLSLVACAPTSQSQSYRTLKCPACGHTFEAPMEK